MLRPIHFVLFALGAFMVAGCATPPPPPAHPPAASDWSTEFLGHGGVKTSITNASGSALFLKVRTGEATAAQTQLAQNGTRDVFLASGSYNTAIRITTAGNISYYRGPGFNIPPNSSHMLLSLQPGDTSHLTPISREEFER